MKIVEMKLNPLPFKQIKEGSKTIEVRLFDEKRKILEIGDKIIFVNTKTSETIEKEVVDLTVFFNFNELFEAYDSILLGARGYTNEQYCESMHAIYSEEKEKQYGVLAISLEETDKQLRERKVAGEQVYNGALLKVYKDTILLPNEEISYREWIQHNGASAVVCVDKDDNIVLVKQYRYPFGKTVLEIPAGKLDSILEDPKDCAIRELKEETGYISKDMTYLGETALAMAYSNEVIYLYYTNEYDEGENNLDSDEFLTAFKIPFDKALEMCNNGEIIDSKTIIGINLYNNLVRKNKRG